MDSTSLELDHHHHTSFLITKGRRTKRQRSSTTTTTTTVTSTSSSHAGGGASGGDGGARSDNDYYSSSSTATQPDHDIASHVIVTAEEEDMANCLILLAQGINRARLANPTATTTTAATATTTATATATSVYECKTCNRSFPSFQALGGHRASHKKPKPNPNPKPNPIPAVSSPSDRDIVDDEDESESTNHKTNNSTNLIRSNVINDVSKGMIMRVHECSICGSEFPSGQALGGHMRRHRAPPLPAPSPSDRPIRIGGGAPRIGLPPLDLNLPAPSDDHEMIDDHMETKFHVLPTPALVDCHY